MVKRINDMMLLMMISCIVVILIGFLILVFNPKISICLEGDDLIQENVCVDSQGEYYPAIKESHYWFTTFFCIFLGCLGLIYSLKKLYYEDEDEWEYF